MTAPHDHHSDLARFQIWLEHGGCMDMPEQWRFLYAAQSIFDGPEWWRLMIPDLVSPVTTH